MALDFYDKLLQSATLRRDAGAKITGERAYFSARNPVDRVRRAGKQFEGTIERGKCIDCTGVSPPDVPTRPCDGIAGKKIFFACGKKPKSKVFSRSNVHRGNRGVLRGSYVCRILVTYALPANAAQGSGKKK